MPPPIAVILADYSPKWPQIAAILADEILAAAPVFRSVHHIGSTAVPGLLAKPVIDLMPVVVNMEELDEQRSRVVAAGYEWHGEYGIPGRRYCTRAAADGTRLAQLHIFQLGSPHISRHIAFRDYLRAHPDVARDYAVVKQRARDLYPDDSHAYGDEKSAFVQEHEARALLWAKVAPAPPAAS